MDYSCRSSYGKMALFVVLCAVLMSGCVRLSGGAGYSHTDSEGNVKNKQVGFDTADYVPGSPAPGSITVN